jgi:hypothetical protein
LAGFKVCGKRGTHNFVKAKRPVNRGNGKFECEKGWIACDETNLKVKTFCVPENPGKS